MHFIRRLGKYILYFLVVLLLLFGLVAIAIQYPSVQTYLSKKATEFLSEQLKAEVEVGGVDIDFFKTAVLEEVFIADQQKDTLLYAGRLGVDIGLFNLLRSEIYFNEIKLENTFLNTYRQDKAPAFNYQFIIDNFTSDGPKDTSAAAPWKFGVGEVILQQVRFDMRDEGSGRFDLKTDIDNWSITADDLDFEQQKIALGKIDLRDSDVIFRQLKKNGQAIVSPKEQSKLDFPGFGWTITAEELSLQNNHVAYLDDNAPALSDSLGRNMLDYNHLDLQDLNLSIDDIQYADDGIKLTLNKGSCKDQSGFVLKNISGKAAVLPNEISIENLQLQTPNSNLQNSTRLAFNEFNDLTDFLYSVKLNSQFANTTLSTTDLLAIAPQIREVPNLNLPEGKKIRLTGRLELQSEQLRLEHFSFAVGEKNILQASGGIAQLTSDPDFDLDVQHLSSSYEQLEQYTTGLELPAGLANFGQIQLSGKIEGTLGDLKVDDFILGTESATRFTGNLRAACLPDLDSTVFGLEIMDLATRSTDLSGFAQEPFPPMLDSLGLVQFTGTFNGTTRHFSIDGEFNTAAGGARTDLEMNFNRDYDNADYRGQLVMDDFDLGRVLLDTAQIGKVSLDVQLDGGGFSLDSLNTTLQGVVKKAVFNQYEYNDLKIDGRFTQRLFEGKTKMEDENLSFHLLGKVDLNDSLPELDATIQLDTINLKQLNFYAEPLGISGLIEARTRGGNLDDLEGEITLSNLHLASDKHIYSDKKLVIGAKQLQGGERALSLDADFLTASVEGAFNFRNLRNLVVDYVNELFPVEELALTADTLSSQQPRPADQRFGFDFQFTDLTALARVFLPAFEELDTTAFLRGKFDSAGGQLELTAEFPRLVYQSSTLDSLVLHVNGDGRQLHSDVALRKLNFNNAFYAPFIDLNTRLGDDSLRFDLAVLDDSLRSVFRWGANSVKSLEDYRIVFNDEMILDEKAWNVDPQNRLYFSAKNLFVNDLIFSKNQQLFGVNSIGDAPENDVAPLELRFDNFNLSEISALLNNPLLQLTGHTNGAFTIIEPRQNLHYNANLTVKDLTLNEQPLGDFLLEASQPSGRQVIDILAQLKKDNQMLLEGEYDISQNQFDLSADIDKLSMVVVDPFLTDLIRHSKGYLSGNFTLEGTPEIPEMNGKIKTHDISTRLLLNGTRYRTNESTITISEKTIDFGELELYDPEGRKASINGAINHEYFGNITFDLRAQTDGLKILNTDRKDNQLYYGRLFAGADVQISGTPELPKLDVYATTQDSSLLNVEPLASDLVVVQEDYVIFANPNDYEPDSLEALTRQVGRNSLGFDLNLTLVVTPAARLHIIIDPLTGDELYCVGSGNFTVTMNPAGDIGITGTYIIEEGQYSFAYEGLVKRDFEIRKGSSLSFAGDPYDARFDITAVYNTRATTYELISNEATLDEATLASSQRRTDVEVLMNIDGDLTEPAITFDIDLPQNEGSAVDNLAIRKLNELRDEPNELNKQVFGLLFLNSFFQSETGAGLSNVGENAALKSVSSLISNQLNRLAGSLIKGIDLTLGFESYRSAGQDAGTVSELQVGLSKKLFNDRLTIMVGGNFNLESSQQSELQEGGYSAIAGDFVLEYKLTDSGRYLVKVFHKSDYNALLGTTNKTGVGLMFRKSY
ncbi:MAG: translocation/assembly module TamB domain-containing protein [Bacteroidota bacterium]